MKQIIIQVADKDLSSLLEVIESLDYVQIIAEDGVPSWQKSEVRERLEDYQKNPKKGLDLDSTLEDLEKDL